MEVRGVTKQMFQSPNFPNAAFITIRREQRIDTWHLSLSLVDPATMAWAFNEEWGMAASGIRSTWILARRRNSSTRGVILHTHIILTIQQCGETRTVGETLPIVSMRMSLCFVCRRAVSWSQLLRHGEERMWYTIEHVRDGYCKRVLRSLWRVWYRAVLQNSDILARCLLWIEIDTQTSSLSASSLIHAVALTCVCFRGYSIRPFWLAYASAAWYVVDWLERRTRCQWWMMIRNRLSLRWLAFANRLGRRVVARLSSLVA